ncbi:ATP-binding protein [Candidatus Daviesbacteria bacterium]|nr:ATP-binding protein [Candidatus Daviesbacteria bacterium]
MDTEILKKLIDTWNPHFTNPQKGGWIGTVTREKYLSRLKKLLDIRHVLILTGVRRAGKSTLMQQMVKHLLEEKTIPARNILFLFLEDILAQQYLSLGWKFLDDLYNFYLETYDPQGQVYLFLDEIQGIKDFNRWIASKYERKEPVKFILSGSRRALVESESATVLTGRNVVLDIYPLNFYEYLLMRKVDVRGDTLQSLQDANFSRMSTILHHLGNYMFEGGYPEIILAPEEEVKKTLAAAYYSDIISRDVLKPNAIRNAQEVEVLGLQIMSDFTRTHTYSSLGRPQKLSVDAVKSYLEYFEKAYLFFESRHFSYKTKETQDIQRPRKIYVVDNGLRNFNIPLPRLDIGQCAENIVYMELKRNNPAVYYWRGKREIDFVVMSPNLSFVNVSYTDQPHDREAEGLVEGLSEFNLDQGIVLTKNYADVKKIEGKKIEFIPLWAWLILNGKEFFQEGSRNSNI